MTPARFRWGIIFVTVGLLLLLRNLGVFNDNFWLDLLVYSPVLLIAIGIEKIFSKTRFKIISYLTSVALLAVALGIAFYSGTGGVEGSFFSKTNYRIEFDPSVDMISADLDLGSTDLTIRDSGDDLVYGRFSRFTRKPRITYSIEDNQALLDFKSRRGSYLGGAITIDTDEDQDWYVRFSDRIPLDLSCASDGSDIHLNLSTTPLRHLALNVEDADVYLMLGDLEPEVRIEVEGIDTRLRLRVPETIGLRITAGEYGDYLERIGLIDMDGLYITEGYDSTTTKVEMEVDDDLSSFSIDFF